MATRFTDSSLDEIRLAFATDTDRCGKLSEFILALQGSGNQTVNDVVNDLVFLRRELMLSYPNETAIRTVLNRIVKKIRSTGNLDPQLSPVLKQVNQTIARLA